MIAYLQVTSAVSGKVLGMLQIGKNDPSATSDGRWFEWQGVNGSSDGGTWHWSNSAFYGDVYTMILISNEKKEKVGHVENGDWQMDEPKEPLFKPDSEGWFFHYVPGWPANKAKWKKV